MTALEPHATTTGSESRLRQLVGEHMDFVWRAFRRLGVREADCDDGCQRVWLVVSKKLGEIVRGKERSFIFSVVVRLASEMRRCDVKHNSWDELGAGAPQRQDLRTPEQDLENKQALEVLDAILSTLSFEQRAVFVLFELEGFSSVEIAEQLRVSRGTVASRLRLARDGFTKALAEQKRESSYRRHASGE